MEKQSHTEARGALLDKVGTRPRPTVYIVQLNNFDVKPVKSGRGKVMKMQPVGGKRILQILAGPLYFGTPAEQLEAMAIALDNKNRWPAETVGEEPIRLGVCDSDYGKPREATPYDETPEGEDCW